MIHFLENLIDYYGWMSGNRLMAHNASMCEMKNKITFILQSDSLNQFKTDMINVEIPIDSNMMVFTGNNSEFLDIFDVYRPFPTAEIR